MSLFERSWLQKNKCSKIKIHKSFEEREEGQRTYFEEEKKLQLTFQKQIPVSINSFIDNSITSSLILQIDD